MVTLLPNKRVSDEDNLKIGGTLDINLASIKSNYRDIQCFNTL